MTPWIDAAKIRVGPIGPEERRTIDAQLVRLLAQHRIVAGVKHAAGRPSRTAGTGARRSALNYSTLRG